MKSSKNVLKSHNKKHTLLSTISNKPIQQAQTALVPTQVYVIGLGDSIYNQNILKSQQYFGKYGIVDSVILCKTQTSIVKWKELVTGSALINYRNQKAAAVAIVVHHRLIESLFKLPTDQGIIQSCYGRMKYCFKGMKCTKSQCTFLHERKKDRQQRQDPKDFQGHLKKAQNVIIKNYGDIIEKLKKKKRTLNIFPDAYEVMKIVIDSKIMNKDEYIERWSLDEVPPKIMNQIEEKPDQIKSTTTQPIIDQAHAIPKKSEKNNTGQEKNKDSIAKMTQEEYIHYLVRRKFNHPKHQESILECVRMVPVEKKYLKRLCLMFERAACSW